MNTRQPMFVRALARIDDPPFVTGHVAGHRARRLIDAPDAEFTDPFVLMAEDWSPPGLFAFHPHRGIETAAPACTHPQRRKLCTTNPRYLS